MYFIFNNIMDGGLIAGCICLFFLAVVTYLYVGDGECCQSPEEEEEEQGNISPSSSSSTVRVTSPLH